MNIEKVLNFAFKSKFLETNLKRKLFKCKESL